MEFSHPCDICRRRLIQQELDYSSQRGRVLVSPTPWAQDVGLLGPPVSPAPRQSASLDSGRRGSACGLGRGSGRASGASVWFLTSDDSVGGRSSSVAGRGRASRSRPVVHSSRQPRSGKCSFVCCSFIVTGALVVFS